jgi:4-amino-4-deoxy-L-arabinose transferase-like glycosyltransferase
VVATRYGYHRDELYFLEASRHMAWGYVDQPPLSIALVWVSRTVFGDSLLGLRVLPALAAGGVVLFAGLLAREFGRRALRPGIRRARGRTVAAPPCRGHLAGPTIYDLMAWAAVSWLVVRILRTGRDRLWPMVGLVAGLALLNKETILLLLGGLVLGLLLDRRWEVFRSPWLWMARCGMRSGLASATTAEQQRGQARQSTSVTAPPVMRTRPIGTGAPVHSWYSPSASPSITAA